MIQEMVKQDSDSKEIEKAFRHVFPEQGLQVVKFGDEHFHVEVRLDGMEDDMLEAAQALSDVNTIMGMRVGRTEGSKNQLLHTAADVLEILNQ